MRLRAIQFLLASFVLVGCISPKPYVDPKYGAIDYQDVQVEAQDVELSVIFMRDGKPIKRAERQLRASLEGVLTQAGFVIVETEGEAAQFRVSFNNIPEEGAFSKGFGTGLTFGLAGTAISDFYEVTISLTDGETTVERAYAHAIHTTVGNTAAPVENVSPSRNLIEAFDSVVEDVVLQFLKDMEADEAGDVVASLVVTMPSAG